MLRQRYSYLVFPTRCQRICKSPKLILEGITAYAEDRLTKQDKLLDIFNGQETFNLPITFNDVTVEKVNLSKSLGFILDPEVRFSKHIELKYKEALMKLNILQKL